MQESVFGAGKWFNNNNLPVNLLKTICMLTSSSGNLNKIADADDILSLSLHDDPLSQYDDVIKWKHFPRNWPFARGIPAQRPVTRSFGVFFYLRLNKRLSKQSWGWWFETLSRPLWRHCNEVTDCPYLGIQLDQCLKWDARVLNLCKKVASKLSVLNRLRNILSREMLSTCSRQNLLCIQPCIDYAISVWGTCSKQL